MTDKLLATEEQRAIIEAAASAGQNLMIYAYAGCGKTTTLTMLAEQLPEKRALALAFNVKIKKELEQRFPSHFHVKTLNGLGHSAWGKAIGKALTLDDKKLGKLVTECAKQAGFAANTDQWNTIRTLVSAAQQSGLVPENFGFKSLLPDTQESWKRLCEDQGIAFSPSPALLDLARTVLISSIRLAYKGLISFDDQIYMSAMFGGAFPRYDAVLVDEAQDLSPLNHIQLQRCAAGRLIVCGDPKQAIYAFRGADSASMPKIKRLRKDWIELPLALTFRCPKAIVRRQQDHAPGYRCAESAPSGAFLTLAQQRPSEAAEAAEPTWTWPDLEALRTRPVDKIAILCRNNAPLLGMAFKLIRRRVGVVMLGRDIGKGLVVLIKKLCKDPELGVKALAEALTSWEQKEIQLALANDQKEKADKVRDRAECIRAVLEFSDVSTVGEATQTLVNLFARDAGLVTLATGHRAKGLEWDIVLHLDPWRIPSRYAKDSPAALEQEMNLKYVIETRAKSVLCEASLNEFK